MEIEEFSDQVREDISQLFGDTSDLSEELVNTLCNIYYFARKAKKLNFGGLTDIKMMFPGKSESELLKRYMEHMAHITSAAEHAPVMVESMRQVRKEKKEICPFIEQVTVDLLKYGIENAEAKPAFLRWIQRKLKTPAEYRGLTELFNVSYRKNA